jgi:hypothetical protein
MGGYIRGWFDQFVSWGDFVKHFMCAAIAAVAVWGGTARAAVLVDSGTPVGPEDVGAGKVNKAVYYDGSTSNGQFISQAFTLGSGAVITGIDSYFSAPPGGVVDVRLTTQTGPGTTAAHERAHFTLTSTQFEPQFYGSAPLAVALPAGTYYLVYSAATNAGAGFPNWAPTDVGVLTFANTFNGSDSSINPSNPAASGFFSHDDGDIGLRVHGVVPEPAGVALVAVGLIVATARRRRRAV